MLLLAGCYQSHLVADDGDVRFDGGVWSDGAPDGLDSVDAAADDADTCVERFVVDGYWPSGEVDSMRSHQYVSTTPLWADFDGDGVREVAFVSHDEVSGVLRIVDDGRVYTAPTAELTLSDNIAAGDLDGDGDLEIIAVRRRWGLLAYDHRAREVWFGQYPVPPSAFEGVPDVRTPLPISPTPVPLRPGPGDVIGPTYIHRSGGAPSVHDLDSDGAAEVLFGGMVLEGRTGDLRWSAGRLDGWMGTNHVFGPYACVADLTSDGVDDVVFGGQAWTADGALLWAREREYEGFCAVADFGEGPSVVVVDDNDVVVLEGSTGRELAAHQLGTRAIGGFGGAGGPAVVARFRGSPRMQIAVGTTSGVSFFDPTCATCAAFYPFDLPRDRFGGGSPIQTLVAFDEGRDGIYELLLRTRDRLMMLDGERRRIGTSVQSLHLSATPIPVDLEGDGDVEILVGLAPYRLGDVPEVGIAVVRPRCEPLTGDVESVVSPGFGSAERGTYRAIPSL